MISTIDETYVIRCPYARAKELLRAQLQEPASNGKISKLTLTLPIGSTSISRDVLVTYQRGLDPMHFDEPWNVRWAPENGGPYPDFEGELTIRADEDYDTSILELRGSYTAPMGALGQAFDFVAGSRIASETLRGLLASIALAMERAYEVEEIGKSAAGNGVS
jgi:hypothetical protein